MGLNRGNLLHYMEWSKMGLLPKNGSILDIGAQQIYLEENDNILDEYCQYFGEPLLTSEEKARISKGGYVGELHKKAAFHYNVVDISDEPYVIRVDLNFDPIPADHQNRYDLVANHGTTEHVLNQLNAMKVMHDAAKNGGIMHHILPMTGNPEHGLVCYTPKFFWAMAEANHYKTIAYSLWIDSELKNMEDDVPGKFENGFMSHYNNVWSHILFQKTTSEPFKCFTDPFFA